MSTGGSHAPLQESMAALEIPTMTKQSFFAAEKCIGEWWSTLPEETMKTSWPGGAANSNFQEANVFW